MTDAQKTDVSPVLARPQSLARWLFVVAALVIMMVVVGGITRLTESGLSITEWKPITGALPPLTDSQWNDAFAKYQQIPEYREINRGMSLQDFQYIFFWEWSHRLLARIIGIVFAVPLLWFAVKRAIPRGYGWRLVAILALGGMQGAIGWWMVASGLVDRTDVSHYRLAAHLITALFIMAGCVWTALDLLALTRDPDSRPARLTSLTGWASGALLVQLLWGAYVAGLNAGYVSNTWPLMNDCLFPGGVEWHGSLWATVSDDPYFVHFFHRWWAWVVAALLIILARRARMSGSGAASISVQLLLATQIVLGIATVWSGMALPLAVLHQANGALLVAATVWASHAVGMRL